MSFEAFLKQKLVDSAAFRQQQPEMWESFSGLYEEIGEKSFDLQKKFYFNDLRGLYPLPLAAKEEPKPASTTQRPKLSLKGKPRLKPSLKTKSEGASADSPPKPRPKLKLKTREENPLEDASPKPRPKPKLKLKNKPPVDSPEITDSSSQDS